MTSGLPSERATAASGSVACANRGNVSDRAWWRITAGSMLILICGFRLMGAVAMVARGAAVSDDVMVSHLSVRALGVLMLVIAGLGVRVGIGMLSSAERWWRWGVGATMALWADGVLNGFVLFGVPRLGGQVLNAGVAAVLVGTVVLAGRRASAVAAGETAKEI